MVCVITFPGHLHIQIIVTVQQLFQTPPAVLQICILHQFENLISKPLISLDYLALTVMDVTDQNSWPDV